MQESIVVHYTQLLSSLGYHHKFIVYTRSDGTRWAIRAYPSGPGGSISAAVSAALTGGGSGYGYLDVSGPLPWNEDFADKPSEVVGSETIQTGADLSETWSRIVGFAQNIKSGQYHYNPFAQNSNTFVDEILIRSGLPLPSRDSLLGYWAPGSITSFPTPTGHGHNRRLGQPQGNDPTYGFTPSGYGWSTQFNSYSYLEGDPADPYLVTDAGDFVIVEKYELVNGVLTRVFYAAGDKRTGELVRLDPQTGEINQAPATAKRDPATGAIDWGSIDWEAVGVVAAQSIGSTLGRRLFGDDLLGAFGGAVGGQLASAFSNSILGRELRLTDEINPVVIAGFEVDREVISFSVLDSLGINMASAGAGALTSYLIGEAFSELGVNGFAGEALNAATSFALSKIAENITQQALGVAGVQWNTGLEGANFVNFAGSFLGSKLASFVKTFDTVGGQIGFSVGGAIGSVALASVFANSTAIIANFLAPGVGAFVGALLGGLIGSVFGGTPESGAHVIWDAATGKFKIGTTWADDWGSSAGNDAAKARAVDVATVPQDVLNRLVAGFGDSASAYQNPSVIGPGAYGQRSDKWLYWGNGENSLTHPSTGQYADAMDAINHGLRVALDSVSLQGGDIYLKRAFYKSLETNQNRADYDFGQLVGDLSIAADLSYYSQHRPLIDATIGLAPETAVAQGWMLTLLRGAELNLDQFYKSDFYGGLQGYLEGSGFLAGNELSPADIKLAFGSNGDLIISDGGALPSGQAVVGNGWWSNYSAETRWSAVAGPDGETVTAMETGQLDTGIMGGGSVTHNIAIDGSKTYEFSIYVRKHDLSNLSHSLYFGAASYNVVNAVTGAADDNPYFWYADHTRQQAILRDDRWYKVVGYVLPEGQRLTAQSAKGGVYDTVTGQKVADVTNFAWNPARTSQNAYLRFFSYHNAPTPGFSTYWYQPEVRIIADGRPGSNLVDLSGWAAPPRNTLVIPDFAATMGYTAPVSTAASHTGTVHSDIVFATGAANVTLADAATASVAAGPGVTGLSRLSDDIFVGNAGHNRMWGHAGWDWLEGGAGVDELWGGEGNDFLSGGDGADYVQAWNGGPAPGGLFGGEGNDTLVGGAGADALFGENGDDVLIVDQNDNAFDYLAGGAGLDTVTFERWTAGITVDMNTGKQPGYTSVIFIDGWVDVENVTGSDLADSITGDLQNNVLSGRLGNDNLYGGEGADRLIGGGGADRIDGQGGIDTASYRDSRGGVNVSLVAGTGSDGDAEGDTLFSVESVEGSDEADILQGGPGAGAVIGLDGNDILRASAGATAFDGGEGADTVDYSESTAAIQANLGTGAASLGWAQGDTFKSVEQVIGSNHGDTIYGSAGAERFQGGGGTDYLYGQSGDDSYAFTSGSGVDYVTDSGGYYDYIVVDRAISLDSLKLGRSGSTLVVERQDAGDKVYVNSHYAAAYSLQSNHVEHLTWKNGSYIWLTDVTAFANGAATNDVLAATSANDLHHGHQGNDTLYGGYGNDILIGGSGSDRLEGGQHSDSYVFGRGSGLDTILDSEGNDTLVMADDIAADELLMAYSGNHLHIGLKVAGNDTITAFNAPDRLVIENQKLAGTAIESIQFGGHRISLPKVAGQTTSSNTYPQITTSSLTKQARFYGGTLGWVGAFDAEGDPLTFTVTAIDSTYPSGNFYFVNGTSQLYTTATWVAQDYSTSYLTVSVSDGTNVTSGQIQINWQPDPNGGPLWPIVLDLDGDGLDLVKPQQSGISWDVDEDGRADKLGWVGAGDALLAFDRNGSDTVDEVGEISFINDAEGATSDLEGLRGFDHDVNGVADGVLDASDVFFHEFMLWQDLNQNGISEAGELRGLAEAGISSIGLAGTPTGESAKSANKNAVLNTGSFEWADGRIGSFGDVVLGVRHGTAGGHGDEQALIRGEAGLLIADKVKKSAGATSDAGGGTLAPVILDLGLDGIDLVPIGRSPIHFDADNDGVAEWTGWTVPGDALLALDLDGDGLITRGEEISFTQYRPGAASDLEGLAAFDGNGDGTLDAADPSFGRLLLWTDINMDGVSQEGELGTLEVFQVVSISLDGRESDFAYGGNRLHQAASFRFADGKIGILGDVSLGFIEIEESWDGASAQTVTPTASADSPAALDPQLDTAEPARHSAEPGPRWRNRFDQRDQAGFAVPYAQWRDAMNAFDAPSGEAPPGLIGPEAGHPMDSALAAKLQRMSSTMAGFGGTRFAGLRLERHSSQSFAQATLAIAHQ